MTDDPIPPRDREQSLAALSPALQELVALERQRIDAADRRTEVAFKMIEATDAADKREHEYHTERLRKTAEARKERWRSILRFVWAMSGAGAIVVAFLLLMLFFGTDVQRETAGELLQTALTALGGAGILWLSRALFKRAMGQSRDD